MHDAARSFIASHVSDRTFGSVLEIGSRDVNGEIRSLFTSDIYLGCDISAGPGVDIVMDAELPDSFGMRFDAVVCCEVFEHTHGWPLIVENIARWLEPGGVALLTMAAPGRLPHSAIDGEHLKPGEYYSNIDPDALRRELDHAGLDSVLTLNGQDLYAWAVR